MIYGDREAHFSGSKHCYAYNTLYFQLLFANWSNFQVHRQSHAL